MYFNEGKLTSLTKKKQDDDDVLLNLFLICSDVGLSINFLILLTPQLIIGTCIESFQGSTVQTFHHNMRLPLGLK